MGLAALGTQPSPNANRVGMPISLSGVSAAVAQIRACALAVGVGGVGDAAQRHGGGGAGQSLRCGRVADRVVRKNRAEDR